MPRCELDASLARSHRHQIQGGYCGSECVCTASICSPSHAPGPVTARHQTSLLRLPPRCRAQAADDDRSLAVGGKRYSSDGVRLSLTASSVKPHVFTMTRSAPSNVLEVW